MLRFRPDNTEGYDQNDLDEMNSRFENAVAEYRRLTSWEPFCEAWDKSTYDHLAEEVQSEFDAEKGIH